MNWDRVSNEDKFRRGGTQRVGGGSKNFNPKSLPKKRKAVKAGTCKSCHKEIQVGQKIVQGAGRPAVHAGCFQF